MKDLDKLKKLQEEREEEERIKREQEKIKRQFEVEENKKKMTKDLYIEENKRIAEMNKATSNKVNERKFNHNRQSSPIQEPPKIMEQINNQYINQEDLQLRLNLNNEIIQLRNHIIDQQNQLLAQINDLKAETQNANLQRYEALKEISYLKEELAKQRVDEELRKKYVYDVLVDNNSKVNNIYSHTKLPEINEREYGMELPKTNTIKNMMYEDSVRHPNRVPKIPKYDELRENELKVTSKFIDVDNYNVTDV